MESGAPVGRRVVLGLVVLGAAGVVFGRRLSDATTAAVATVAPGLQKVLPATGGFRIYTVTNGYPERTVADYRLTLQDGDRRTVLTYDDLADLPQTGLTKDFQCVTGWRVDDAVWTGVLLSDLLGAAAIDIGSGALQFTSFDGVYTESLTKDQALRSDVLVATTLYGQPLERAMGGPVRLVVAPMYGYKSLKWLDGIIVTDEVVPGYWEERGYDIDALGRPLQRAHR
ncbi:MAG: molybdopterin-dependent oxidoreductase [Candidatus Nanopelagicales bacterium]